MHSCSITNLSARSPYADALSPTPLLQSSQMGKSKGRDCVPQRRHGPCTLAPRRKPKGSPCVLSKACETCAKWRCASHCDCALAGKRTGRNAARTKADAVAANVQKETPAEAAAPQVAPPVGRMPNMGFQSLKPKEWYAAAFDAVKAASHVVCSSYQYDHKGLTELFLKQLGGRSRDFSLLLLVDKECFEKGTPPRQHKMLGDLRKAGAMVVLCRGTAKTGSMHGKSLVADRRSAFVGSANLTDKSERNGELCWVLRGQPVLETLQFLREECAGGTAWQ